VQPLAFEMAWYNHIPQLTLYYEGKRKYEFGSILCKLCGERDKGFWSFPSLRTPLRNTSRCGKSRASAVIESWCVDCTLELQSLRSNHQTQSTRFGLLCVSFYCMCRHRDMISCSALKAFHAFDCW